MQAQETQRCYILMTQLLYLAVQLWPIVPSPFPDCVPITALMGHAPTVDFSLGAIRTVMLQSSIGRTHNLLSEVIQAMPNMRHLGIIQVESTRHRHRLLDVCETVKLMENLQIH